MKSNRFRGKNGYYFWYARVYRLISFRAAAAVSRVGHGLPRAFGQQTPVLSWILLYPPLVIDPLHSAPAFEGMQGTTPLIHSVAPGEGATRGWALCWEFHLGSQHVGRPRKTRLAL